jgi:hypothetical protein
MYCSMWTGNGRMTRHHKSSQILQASESRIWLGTSQIWSRDANYPTATSETYYHHEQQQRYSLRSSASAVTEARILPFTTNYVQIECGPFSLLPGGYWDSYPRGKQQERENGHSPHLVSVRNEKLQPSLCLCNSPCSCDNFCSRQARQEAYIQNYYDVISIQMTLLVDFTTGCDILTVETKCIWSFVRVS